MTDSKRNCDLGMVGLGVMGRNLLLNMADHGYAVAGYDQDPNQVKQLQEESDPLVVHGTTDIQEFIDALRRPRAIMMLVPAGPIVDSVIQALLPHLEAGDLIIDAGNSYFKDTDRRAQDLTTKGIQFLGVGISGGEEGARHGPSIMPGGPKAAYERVRPILEAVAAKVNGDPCVTYLGPGSAGHFVKMVHNGIEYGIMQLISESYDLMKRGLNFNDDQLRDVYNEWNQGDLNCYLIEITSRIFGKVDEKTGNRLINDILPVAKQNGTGMWTSQSAMELQIPVPTIDLAVSMRDLSVFSKERAEKSKMYSRAIIPISGDQKAFVTQLSRSLFAAMKMTYRQGFAVMKAASVKYQYDLDLKAVSRIWQGGCIIRSKILNSNILDQPLLTIDQEALRQVVCDAITSGIPIPGLMVSLSYFDAYRSAWLPANLIQAQRDYFGAHTYERTDMAGTFHTEWEKP